MNWRRILARHLHVDKARAQCRVRNVHGCHVDLRSCPAPNIVIDVDECMAASPELAGALSEDKKCDLVLLYGDISSMGVLFIEVKNARYNKQIDRGLKQILRSKARFDELSSSVDSEISISAYDGILVSDISRRSTGLLTKLRRIVGDQSITLALARCGEDVWRDRWGAL